MRVAISAALWAATAVAVWADGTVPVAGLDTVRIEQLTGAKGKLDPGEPGVFKVSVPRSDLAVIAAGVHLTPPMGLTSWAAFKKASGAEGAARGEHRHRRHPPAHGGGGASDPVPALLGVGRTRDLARGLRNALDRTTADSGSVP